ncbi:DUF1285 domain-containing protein [Alsobacter sp. R-9]
MSQETRDPRAAATSPLESLTTAARAATGRGLPPVHRWNPPWCGDIDMRIAADGTWFYAGTPIGRPALVRLFSTILRKDPTGYVLVTPVERVGIEVDDVPFLAVEMAVSGEGSARALSFRTTVDDWTTAGVDRPLRFEREATGGLRPYVLVRDALWARVNRPVFYDMVELGEEADTPEGRKFGVRSGGVFFPMADAGDLEGLA